MFHSFFQLMKCNISTTQKVSERDILALRSMYERMCGLFKWKVIERENAKLMQFDIIMSTSKEVKITFCLDWATYRVLY